MKTQVNKLEREQAKSNRIVFLYLLIFGIIAFSVSGKNFIHSISDYSESTFVSLNNNNPNSELVALLTVNSIDNVKSSNLNYIIPLEAKLLSNSQNYLEMNRLENKMHKNSQYVYQQTLKVLADVEEPELLIEDILLQLDIQEASFNASQLNHLAQKQNAYLNELYKQKNHKVWNEIEQAHQFATLLKAENESNLNLESWMMDGNSWELSAKENKKIEQSLAQIYAQKNAEVYEAIKREMTLRNLAVVESEEPLTVEDWMVEKSENTFNPAVVKNDFLANMVTTKINEVDEIVELIEKTKCCGIVEKEEPLAVEFWMISDRCWCPNKKQIKYLNNEWFAMSDTK